jgi:hypothetical protein
MRIAVLDDVFKHCSSKYSLTQGAEMLAEVQRNANCLAGGR